MRKTILYCDHCRKQIDGHYHSKIPIYCKTKEACEGGLQDRYLMMNQYADYCDECFHKRMAKTLEIVGKTNADEDLLYALEVWLRERKNMELKEIFEFQNMKEGSP